MSTLDIKNQSEVKFSIKVPLSSLPPRTSCSIDTILYGDNCCFDIILSKSDSSSNVLLQQAKKAKKEAEAEAARILSITRSRMLMLLKDSYSVDVCFVFDDDKSDPKAGLWAHRSILSSYSGFATMIEDAVKHRQLSTLDPGVTEPEIAESDKSQLSVSSKECYYPGAAIIIPIKNSSMAAFCVLLRYIYMDHIDLVVDTSIYALSAFDSAPDLDHITITSKDSLHWRPQYSTLEWKPEDVTWEELLEAARPYGIPEIQARIVKEATAAINKFNALSTLFGIGRLFQSIEEAALTYIVDNMAELIAMNGNPFKPYEAHPACFELMYDVIRRNVQSPK
ncbi:hypothetical protein EDD11_001969 [Mortierella claussenii]|nr:hypothetical protein EDD11_001969 [Mortierella claussenii]